MSKYKGIKRYCNGTIWQEYLFCSLTLPTLNIMKTRKLSLVKMPMTTKARLDAAKRISLSKVKRDTDLDHKGSKVNK